MSTITLRSVNDAIDCYDTNRATAAHLVCQVYACVCVRARAYMSVCTCVCVRVCVCVLMHTLVAPGLVRGLGKGGCSSTV